MIYAIDGHILHEEMTVMFTVEDITNETRLLIVLITVRQSLNHGFTLEECLKPGDYGEIVEDASGFASFAFGRVSRLLAVWAFFMVFIFSCIGNTTVDATVVFFWLYTGES